MPQKPDDMGDWRRTHYSVEVTPAIRGKQITVYGWLASLRRQGAITFLIIHDRKGSLQVTAKTSEVSEKVEKKLRLLSLNAAVAIRGKVRATQKAPNGAEIVPDDLKIVGVASKKPIFELYAKKIPRIDKRLSLRAVDLRRPEAQAVFEIRAQTLTSFREFFTKEGFLEVSTPKIISSSTEGGAALFPLLYYDKEAFLTQSPQLYKEQLVMPFERVFEIGPAFRAEQSRTMSHLSEFISIDAEAAYVDYMDIVNIMDEGIHHVLDQITENVNRIYKN